MCRIIIALSALQRCSDAFLMNRLDCVGALQERFTRAQPLASTNKRWLSKSGAPGVFMGGSFPLLECWWHNQAVGGSVVVKGQQRTDSLLGRFFRSNFQRCFTSAGAICLSSAGACSHEHPNTVNHKPIAEAATEHGMLQRSKAQHSPTQRSRNNAMQRGTKCTMAPQRGTAQHVHRIAHILRIVPRDNANSTARQSKSIVHRTPEDPLPRPSSVMQR